MILDFDKSAAQVVPHFKGGAEPLVLLAVLPELR